MDTIVEARNVRKVYRLYARPHYRFLDMFGLLRDRAGAYREHAALDGLTLSIGRGEKVAIIGRNGAGKSTFLRLVTGVIAPTSGELAVRGRIHALLQIGTGFHPDFTGRENALAYLAQLGVTGGDAAAKVAEIVDFAELEEYIDQPVKTYSTGMAARLMFATSTAITPHILVLDEVLGVGDAYFAQKSYERMRELCEAQGTTLLLVTHDVYSALKIASRIVWIDRGRILMDGDGPTVVKGYEDSIRVQEEQRLRAKKQQRLKLLGKTSPAVQRLIVEVSARDGRPQPCPVHFGEVSLVVEQEVAATLPLAEEGFGDESGSHLHSEGTCWGNPEDQAGVIARPMLNYGSPFHKVAGVLAVASAVADLAHAPFALRLRYRSEQAVDLVLRCDLGDRKADLGALPCTPGEWVTHTVEHSFAAAPATDRPTEVNATGVQGTGAIRLLGMSMVDPSGRETHFVRHGDPATFTMPFEIAKPDLRERAEVLVAFHKDGGLTACRVITSDLLFDAGSRRTGIIRLTLPAIALGVGSYSVSAGVAREGYFHEEQALFYSINPGLYCSLGRVLEIEVTGTGIIPNGTIFVATGEWSMEADQAGSLSPTAAVAASRAG